MSVYEGSCNLEDIVVEEKQKKVITGPALHVASSGRESMFDIVYWSSMTKAMRVSVWVLRFIKNVQCPSVDSVHDDLIFLGCAKPRLSCYAVFRSLNTMRSCVLYVKVCLRSTKSTSCAHSQVMNVFSECKVVCNSLVYRKKRDTQ